MDVYEEYERNGLIVTINPDDYPESPREWNNVGTMICSHGKYKLGDEQFDADDYDGWDDLKKQLQKDGAVVILPLSLYDHSGITMSVGVLRGWDSGQVGFIYCKQEDVDREWGGDLEKAEAYLRGEVETYDQFLRGDVYGYTITNPKTNEEVESCWGFYGIEAAREEANNEADAFKHPHDAAYAKDAKDLHK